MLENRAGESFWPIERSKISEERNVLSGLFGRYAIKDGLIERLGQTL